MKLIIFIILILLYVLPTISVNLKGLSGEFGIIFGQPYFCPLIFIIELTIARIS